ncbi:MAG: TIGR03546 family protein [Desulfobacterales bacterium]
MIRLIAKLLHVLNSESDPGQISLAFCFGLIVGLTPLMSLHNILILLAAFLMRVNLSAFILSFVVFSGVAHIIDPLFHQLGISVLSLQALEAFWTALYNMPAMRIENFSNTITMGSLVFSFVAIGPFYITSNLLIKKYRDHILTWVQRTRLMQVVKASRVYAAYMAIAG